MLPLSSNRFLTTIARRGHGIGAAQAKLKGKRVLLPLAGHRPRRVIVAKIGLDGHDVGARVIARGLVDAGFEVIYTGIRRRPEDVAVAAVEEGADVVGVSILSGAHMTLLPRLRSLMDEAGGEHIKLIAGGVIPQEDIAELKAAGIDRVFLSGTPVSEIVDYVRGLEQ